MRYLVRTAVGILAGQKDLSLSGRLRLLQGYRSLRRRNYREAAARARALEARYPLAASVKGLLAETMRRQKKTREAVEKAREALELAPFSPRLRRIAGLAALDAGEFTAAIDHLSLAAKTQSQDSAIASSLALSLVRDGRPEEAIRVAEDALATDPSQRALDVIRGTAMILMGRTDQGLGVLRPFLEKKIVRDADLYDYLWKTLVDAGRGEEAVSLAKRILKGERRARTLTQLLLSLKSYDEAEYFAREAIRLQPDDPTNHFYLSSTLKEQLRIAEALEALVDARRLRDKGRFANQERELHALMARAGALEARRSKRFKAGLPLVDEAIRRNPLDARNHTLKASLLRGTGDLTGALAAAEEACALSDDPNIHLLREQIHGLLVTLSGEWLPSVPGEIARLEPAAENRILHILERTLPHRQSGYTVRTSYTLRAQKAMGFDPAVVTRLGFPSTEGVERQDALEIVDGIPHHRLLIPGTTQYGRLPMDVYLTRFAAEAAAVVEQVRPAIIQPASSYVNALVGLALKRHYDIPMVYEVRAFQEDSWTPHREQALGTEFYTGRHRTEAQCMKGADHVVTLAEVMKDEIVERGVDPKRVHVIPNAVDIERFAPQPKNIKLIRSLGMEDRIILGYISTLLPYEGVGTLLRAVRILLHQGMRVSGLVVGDGPELEPLRELAAKLGIQEHMKLIGRVPHDEILDYYSMIDVFVVPRPNLRVCNLVTPLKPFEAMAMERALLVSDIGALREIVAPPERGLTFTADDPESLAAEALPLVENPDLRRKLGKAARAWVARERTWERNGARYRALYEEILGERRALLARR